MTRRALLHLLFSILLFGVLSEVAVRLVFRVPEVTNFNRAQFTHFGLMDAWGLAVTEPGGEKKRGKNKVLPLRNVRIAYASAPDGFAHEHTLNLYGFRGDDFPIDKPAGKTRVLFIGDSYAEGFGVADDQTIPVLFEEALADRAVEALNLGIGGNEFADYMKLARVAVRLLKPDYLFMVMFANDFPLPQSEQAALADPFDLRARVRFRFKPQRRQWWEPGVLGAIHQWREGTGPTPFYSRGPLPFFAAVPAPANPITHLKDGETLPVPPEIFEAMKRGQSNPMLIPGIPHVEMNLGKTVDAEQMGRAYFEELVDLVEFHDALMLVAFIPQHVTVSDHYYGAWDQIGVGLTAPSLATPEFRTQAKVLGELLDELEVSFVDTSGPLIEQEAKGRHLFYPYDSHLTAEGYRLVTDLLVRQFRDLEPQLAPQLASQVAE